MPILEIARLGHPGLRQRAAPVDELSNGLVTDLVADMQDTLINAGGIGLAAPQVGVPLRVVLFHVPPQRANGQRIEMTVLINPEIEPLGDTVTVEWEGCLSIPGLRGQVPRYERIGYRGLNPAGVLVEREASGLHARVVQHEVDHLNGVLYLERMKDCLSLSFEDQLHHVRALEEERSAP